MSFVALFRGIVVSMVKWVRDRDAGLRETRDETRTREGKVWIGTDLREYARGTKRSLASNQPKGANDRREKIVESGNFGELTFILLFLHVRQPVLVRRLIS